LGKGGGVRGGANVALEVSRRLEADAPRLALVDRKAAVEAVKRNLKKVWKREVGFGAEGKDLSSKGLPLRPDSLNSSY